MKAESFGFKNAWVAFHTDNAGAVADVLGLRNRRPSDWEAGIAAAYEYPIGCSVFVTPPLDGWVLSVGLPFSAAVDARPPTFGGLAADWAKQLACEVQYFATHRTVEAHAWARARPGGLERAYLYVGESDEKVLDHGPQSAEEQQIGSDLACPDEDYVMALARLWSLDPSQLGDRDAEVGMGLVGDYGTPPAPAALAAQPRKKPWWRVW